jgi:TPR repeat protein
MYTYWGKLHPEKAGTYQAIRPRSTSYLASQEDLSLRFVEFLSLARRGDATSQLNVAQMYHAGRGISQNLVEAAKWYRRAADQGIPQAQQNLGIAHAMGYGLRQDFVEAYKWLNLACSSYTRDRDRSLAAKARDLVVTRMTASDIAEAQRLSREWVVQREN